MVMIFFLSFSAAPAIAERGYGHGGYSHGYGGHGHSNGHGYWHGWDGVAIGLGAAIVGTAILNSYPREHVTVVEHETHYYPAPPPAPQYRDYDDRQDSYYVPGRVWIPGQYLYEGGGHNIYVPGHWEN